MGVNQLVFFRGIFANIYLILIVVCKPRNLKGISAIEKKCQNSSHIIEQEISYTWNSEKMV